METPKLSRPQRYADAVTLFSGSWKFVFGLSFATVAWVWWNRGDRAFDPYPWLMFNSILTVISTFQSPLIMMSQNRQIERDKVAAEEQAELDRELVRGLHVKLDALLKSRWEGKVATAIERTRCLGIVENPLYQNDWSRNVSDQIRSGE